MCPPRQSGSLHIQQGLGTMSGNILFKRRAVAGFTLVEVLVVVLIVGILVLIGIPQLGKARDEALYSSITSELRNMAEAQERYYHANNTYAIDPQTLDAVPPDQIVIQDITATGQGWSVVATHQNLSSERGCAVRLGNAEAPTLPDGTPFTAQTGLVQCTER